MCILVAWQAEWSKGRVNRYLFPTKVGTEGKAGGAPGAAVGDKAPPHDAPAPRTTKDGAGGPTASSFWAWAVLFSAEGHNSGSALCLVCRTGCLPPCRMNSSASLITDHLGYLTINTSDTRTTLRNATRRDATHGKRTITTTHPRTRLPFLVFLPSRCTCKQNHTLLLHDTVVQRPCIISKSINK